MLELRKEVREEILLLRRRTRDVTGSVVCTVDGILVTADLADDAEQTAALSSAVLSLTRRMADLARLGRFEETLISGTTGFAACYTAGATLVLTVLAGPGTNLGLLRLEGRKTAAKLAAVAERVPVRDRSVPHVTTYRGEPVATPESDNQPGHLPKRQLDHRPEPPEPENHQPENWRKPWPAWTSRSKR
ncbi:roadblock/LC7 domain-containing protein [Thermopolyspora sp. NPDC052614]|uniref:roadblock/LC7 domain-containing protein n=1 Tax=Thermopolyspora sp. NPDC052614 TaxID=3155682 RepID=UPI00342AF249